MGGLQMGYRPEIWEEAMSDEAVKAAVESLQTFMDTLKIRSRAAGASSMRRIILGNPEFLIMNLGVLLADHARLAKELEEAQTLNKFLRDSIGECHLMISRNTSDFQLQKTWEPTSLPPRLKRLIVDRDELKL